jgi:hypothetical protein
MTACSHSVGGHICFIITLFIVLLFILMQKYKIITNFSPGKLTIKFKELVPLVTDVTCFISLPSRKNRVTFTALTAQLLYQNRSDSDC